MKGYRVFTLNENFSDLRKLADKKQNVSSYLVAILDPGVKYESGNRLFDEGLKNRYFVKDPHGNIINGQYGLVFLHSQILLIQMLGIGGHLIIPFSEKMG